MADEQNRKDYRPDDDSMRGKDNQAEALGEEGDENISQSGTTMSGGSGEFTDFDETEKLRR